MRRSLRARLPLPALTGFAPHQANGLARPHLLWAYGLIAAWAAGMIAVPILRWTAGDGVLPWAISTNVILLAGANVVLLAGAAPARAVLRILAVVLVGSWCIEFLGSTTGFPFGHYDYTPALQPRLGGVPLLIPLAWLMMLPGAWAIGQLLAAHRRVLPRAIVAAAALTAWDLFLDPQMVAWGLWVWEAPGGYFGIPWINFGGWFASALVLTLLSQPPALPRTPFLLIYSLTWALQAIGLALFWQMPGPAFFGAVGMGLFVALGWRAHVMRGDTSSPAAAAEKAQT